MRYEVVNSELQRLLYFEMQRRMVWNKFTSTSEESAASIFKVEEHRNEESSAFL
jgi:hypothetical protein